MTLVCLRASLTLLLTAPALVVAAVSLAGPLHAQTDPRAPTNLVATAIDGGVALTWIAPTEDAGSVTGYRVLRRKQDETTLRARVADTGSTATSYTNIGAAERGQTYVYQAKALRGTAASQGSNEATVTIPGTCPIAGSTPVDVTVSAVPIVVTSTTDDYFVLYAKHNVDESTVELPVLVKLGEAGTTTLAENVEALPKERYRVEKYLVATPADIDGDCIDDLTELDNLGAVNPLNPAVPTELESGALSIANQELLRRIAFRYADGDSVLTVIKFVLHGSAERPGLYFINSITYDQHAEFLDDIGVDQDTDWYATGQLIYDPRLPALDGSLGLYRFSLSQLAGNLNLASFTLIERTYTMLAASTPLLTNNLAFHIPNHRLIHFQDDLGLYAASRVNLVFDADIIGESDFTSLNPEVGYGVLRVMDPDQRPGSRDIVIYGALPNELPRVAGIVSTVPQTPLSHVNLRAVQDGIPNAFIRDALGNDVIAGLLGSHVRYEVSEDGWDLRAATRAEVDAHYAASRPASAQTPQRDLSVTAITPLSEIGFDDWDAFGVKAANLAVLRTFGFPAGTVPDGFAIPFYFYDEFMKQHGFYARIREMLADAEFQADFEMQVAKLKQLRDEIEAAPAPQWMLDAIVAMNGQFPEGATPRYRSSTNNEDLPGFNGAGLYDSKTQKPSEDAEDLAKSLKEVYASLWNYRAFIERDFHRIDHLAAAMGVLVHPNFSDEKVNGVAVSFDPLFDDEGRYYVNSQLGEDLVTNPEAHSVPEEILLHRTGGFRVLGISNLVPTGQLLMSEGQMDQLRRHLTVIHDEFAKLYWPAPSEPFAMEIEFKVTVDNNLAIKQARPWVFATPAATPPPPPPRTGGGGGGGFGPAPVAPKFGDGFRTTRSAAENARPGDGVGDPVEATHPDDLAITYSLSGTDAASFAVDEETGQIRVRKSMELELGRTYTVNLTATDSAGFGAIIIVMIEVTEASFSSYDVNANDRIERNEVIMAVSDYFKGLIAKDEVIALIKLYFSG